jgi:hypothetical protein
VLPSALSSSSAWTSSAQPNSVQIANGTSKAAVHRRLVMAVPPPGRADPFSRRKLLLIRAPDPRVPVACGGS